jgi:hypothetical protein
MRCSNQPPPQKQYGMTVLQSAGLSNSHSQLQPQPQQRTRCHSHHTPLGWGCTHAIQAPKIGHVLKVFWWQAVGPRKIVNRLAKEKNDSQRNTPDFGSELLQHVPPPSGNSNFRRIWISAFVGSGKFTILRVRMGRKGSLSKLIFGSGFSIIPAISSQARGKKTRRRTSCHETFASPPRN